jgi:hypothetical protein
MAVRYDVSENPLLDAEVQDLVRRDEDAFYEQNALAETLLGVDTFPESGPFTDSSPNKLLTKVTRAVVLQVNYQVDLGTDGFALQSGDPAEIRRTFRSVRGNQPVVHPQAAIIVEQVLALYAEENATDDALLGWTTVRTVR